MPEAVKGAPAAGAPALGPDAIADGIYGLLNPSRGKEKVKETPEPAPDETETDDTPENSEDETPETETADDETSVDEQPEDEDSEVTEDEVEETPDPLRAVKHQVPGSDHEVEYDELLLLASKGGDYTRKTQQAAEIRKAAEAARGDYGKRLETYDAKLKQIEDALVVMMPKEPDWDAVRRDNPEEYPALFTDWQRYKGRLDAVRAERDSVAAEAKKESGAAQQTAMHEEYEKLIAKVPEWTDEGKRDAELGEMFTTLKGFGYTAEEASNIPDHRTMLLIRDATRWRVLQAKTKAAAAKAQKVGAGPVKTAKPGSALSTKAKLSKADEAARRLAKSGDVNDAADAFFHSMQAQKQAAKRRR